MAPRTETLVAADLHSQNLPGRAGGFRGLREEQRPWGRLVRQASRGGAGPAPPSLVRRKETEALVVECTGRT